MATGGAHAGRRAAAGGLVVALLTSLFVLGSPRPAEAAVVVPFAVEFQTNDNGAIGLFGNNVLTCPVVPATPGRCLNARNGTGATNTLNDNNHVMVNVDADTDPATRNSSSSTVTLPDGSTVLWAGLYWGARLTAGAGGQAAPAAARNQMKLKLPGESAYRTILAEQTFGPTGADQAYQRFREVTDEVQAAGPGIYWGADVAAGTGEDRYGGWSLTVVYRNPTLPLRNLTVFDGFADVGQGEPVTVGISGFLAPESGTVETQLGMVAYDGDRGTTGDRALVIGTPPNPDTLLGTTLSPGTNFFNSTHDLNGATVTTRSPSDLNMLGFDVKNIGAPGAIPNGAQSASIQFSSTGDRYFPGVLTTTINLFSPDFSPSSKTVLNLSGREPAVPGDTLEYTLNYINAGQDGAEDVVATDPIPPGTTYVPDSLEVLSGANTGLKTDAADGDQAEFVGDEVVFRLGTGANGTSGGDLPPGSSTSFRFQVTVDLAAVGTTIVNEARLAYVAATIGDPFTYVPNQTLTPVGTVADLSLTKTSSPDPGLAGGQLTSTLTVQNAGPSPALDVVVTDELPAGVTLVSAPGCSVAATTLTCPIGTLTSGASATVTVTVAIPPGSTATSLVNVASVSSSTADLDPDDNSAGSSVAVTRQADLSVTKTATPATVVPGQTTTYTVTATNNGPSNAENVDVTDTVADPNISLTSATASGAACTVTADVARCSVPVLAPGSSLTMTVVGRVSPDAPGGLAIGNTATATSNTSDTDDADNTATASITTAAPLADIATTKTGTDAVAGGQVTYTVTVTNNGPSSAGDVSLDDVIPAGLDAVSAVSSRGDCTLGATVTCDLGDLPGPDASGQTSNAVVTITANVPPDFPVGDLTNTATTSTSTADPVPGNDDGSVVTQVSALADVSVGKTADPLQPVAGENVTFTVTVTNAGPSTARGVVLDDALPPGLTLISVDPPTCTGAPQLSCPIGDLAPGATVTITVVMNIPGNFPLDPGAVNTATVTTSTSDPAPGNNQATVTVTTRALADLEAVKWDTAGPPPPPGTPPRTFQAGELVTYFVAAVNNGPSSASTVHVVDTLPPGVTFVAFAEGGELVCEFTAPDLVTCDIPGFDPNVGIFFGVTVRVDANLPDGTLLTNSVEVGFTDPAVVDPVSSNNFSSRTNSVVTSADLNVVKRTYSLDLPSGAMTIPSAAPAGAQTGYLIDIRNDGPSVARSVVLIDSSTLTDFFLNRIRLVQPQPVGDPIVIEITADCSFSGGNLQCPLGDLPVFDPGALSWTIQVDGVTLSNAAAGSYENTATLTSPTPDSDPNDNTSIAPITVTAPVATLTIDKTSVGGEDLAGGDGIPEFVPGSTFTYELTVANVLDPNREGAADADGVVVTDTLPPGFTATAATPSQGSCDITPPSTVTCNLGTVLGPGRVPQPPPVVITISGTISPDVRGTATNSATVTSPISTPATATHNQSLFPLADLAITKIPDATEFAAGATAGFSLVVTNAGPSDALSTSVADLIPPGITFDPEQSDPACTLVVDPEFGSFADCDIGFLAVGDTRTVRISGRIDPGLAPGELTNTGFVGNISDADPNNADNVSEAPITVTQSADLVVSKLADSESVTLGDQVTYTVTVTNAGPSHASNVVVTDEIPAGVTFVSAPDGCTLSGGTVTCTAPTLEAGTTASYAIVLEFPVDLEPGPVSNIASAMSATPDPDATNSQASATVEAIVMSDVAITKTLLTNPIVAGQPVTYEISVTNNGPNDAPDVVFSDTLPPGTSFLSGVPPPGGTCSVTPEGDLTIVGCSLDVLAVGETLTGSLTIATSPDLTGTLANTAFVGSGALDNELVNEGSENESTATGEVVVQLDAAVDVVAHAVVVPPGGTASFNVTVTNNGPSLARAVQLVNTLPDGLNNPTVSEPAATPLIAPVSLLSAEIGILQAETCTFVGLTATCELGDLAPGAVISLTFAGQVPTSATDGTVLTDTVSITAEGDTVPANNTDAAIETVRVPLGEPPPGPGPTPPPGPGAGSAAGPAATSGSDGSPSASSTLAFTGFALAGLALASLTLLGTGTLARVTSRVRRIRRPM